VSIVHYRGVLFRFSYSLDTISQLHLLATYTNCNTALLLAGPTEKNRIEAANNKGVEVITALGDLLNRLKEPEETRHETPAQSRSSNSRSADDISGTNTNDVEVKVSRDEENYDDIGEQDEVELERDGYCDDCLRYWDEPGNRDCYTQGCRGNLSGRPWHPPGY